MLRFAKIVFNVLTKTYFLCRTSVSDCCDIRCAWQLF